MGLFSDRVTVRSARRLWTTPHYRSFCCGAMKLNRVWAVRHAGLIVPLGTDPTAYSDNVAGRPTVTAPRFSSIWMLVAPMTVLVIYSCVITLGLLMLGRRYPSHRAWSYVDT